MKKMQRIYFILSYVFFILPPFIWGLVALYFDNPSLGLHIISLIVNVFVLLLIGLVCSILIKKEKLHFPSKIEYKYLLFGFTGNVVVYFYTFQNMMHIQNLVTIYLILLIVLIVRYYLISNKINDWELWILLPIFLFVDVLYLSLTGCGFTNSIGYSCFPHHPSLTILYILYVIICISTIGYYGYKIYLYKRYNFFGLSNIILFSLIGLFVQNFFDVDEKIIGTITIVAIFLVVLDFIVSIVNKTYSSRTLLFYIRTTTFLILVVFIGEEGFFKGDATKNMLVLMVITTYVSLGITILKSIFHVTEELKKDSLSQIDFVPCSQELKERIKSEFGDMQYSHISLEENSYSMVALNQEEIIGFISTRITPLMEPLNTIKEAYLDIIEIKPEFQKLGIGSKLVGLTEQHFKQFGLTQIRGWSSMDRIEAIQLWYSLGYVLSPAIIWKEETKTSIIGYYFIKQL